MSSSNICRKSFVGLFAMILLFSIARAQDYPVYKWNEAGERWEKDSAGGAASRISVGPDGSPWVVTSAGKIYHRFNNSWRLIPGTAQDIGVGADGSVWSIGGNPGALKDGGIFRLDPDGQAWTQVAGAAFNISVSGAGAPWVVNTNGGIYKWVNGGFQQLPGLATDIGVGGDFDSVWVTGLRGGIFYLSRANNWVQVSGDAYRISVGHDGNPWVVTLQRTIYRWVDGKFEAMPGRANDIGVGADGSVWVIGYSTTLDDFSHTPLPPRAPTPAPKDGPVPGANQETLVCLGSRDQSAFDIQRFGGSKPRFIKLVIDFAYGNVIWEKQPMQPGTCVFKYRLPRQDDPHRLVEEVSDAVTPTAEEYLRRSDKYWLFYVSLYATPGGERYYKVTSSRPTSPSVRID